MRILNSLSIFRSARTLTLAFALGFALLIGLSPLLHNHELDFKEFHQNCAPCHMAHSSATPDNPAPEIAYARNFLPILFFIAPLFIRNERLPFSSRAPPAIF